MTNVEQCTMPWIKVRTDLLQKISPILSDADFRSVFNALIDYATSGKGPDGTLSSSASIAYNWLVASAKADREKYLRLCAQMKINRSKGKQKTEDAGADDGEAGEKQ